MNIPQVLKLSIAGRAAIAYVLCNFILKAINIITTPIFTRILNTTDYGTISLYNAWLSILGVIATLSLSSGVLNVGLNEFKKNQWGYLASLLILSNLATLISGLIFIWGTANFNFNIGLPQTAIKLMFLHFLLNPAIEFWYAKQKYNYNYVSFIALTVIITVISTFFSLYCVMNNANNKSVWKIFGNELIIYILGFIIYMFIMIKGFHTLNIKFWKYAFIINGPLIVHTLSKVILDNCGKIMIGYFADKSSVGKYSVISLISTIAILLWSAINSSLVPYTYKMLDEKKFICINKVSKLIMSFYAVSCFIIILFGPEIVKILAPYEYWDAIYVAPPLVASIYFMAVYNLFGNLEIYYKKTNYIMIATLIGMIINIILNFLLIPRFGYIAAAYSSLISYFIISFIHYKIASDINKDNIYDLILIRKQSLLILFTVIISTVLYYLNNMFRYIIILFLLLLMVKKIKKELFKIRL